MRRFLMVLFIMVMIPYVTTLAWTGRLEEAKDSGKIEGFENTIWGKEIFARNKQQESGENSSIRIGTGLRNVIVERDNKELTTSVEEYLVHVLAAQIPADFEAETLKAQAILARTYIYGLMENRTDIYEDELDMDALSTEQMKALWGEKEYLSRLAKIQRAVNETVGLYILYEGTLIEPLFCYASAGKTRSRGEDYPYLKQTESPGDLLAENYRSLPVFEMKEFVRLVNEIPEAVVIDEEELKQGGGIQIVERDSSGYVKQVQIGQKTYTGEEIQYALGLVSPCYSFERLDGKIRIICKGVGHGYGFAQFGANEMAKDGKTYEELLKYYFQNIEIVGTEAV